MNVDSFDEAFQLLKAHGFNGTEGDQARDTGTSRSAMMVSPTGFSIVIVEHIKK
jgi:hypothetical protein